MQDKKNRRKILILIRHAHRDTGPGRELDNGLSRKGKRQARCVLRHIRTIDFGKEGPLVLSSPRRRCIETVTPIADDHDVKLIIQPLLEEGGSVEFKASEFIKWWLEEAPNSVIACSHGDWLPVCLKMLTGSEIKLSKAGMAEIHFNKGKEKEIELVWLVQKPLALKTHHSFG